MIFTGIEDLCSKRDELHKQILLEEEEKQKIQNDLRILTERLSHINESLARKIAMRIDYDKTIAETETAYKKVHLYSRTPFLEIRNFSPSRSLKVHRHCYMF